MAQGFLTSVIALAIYSLLVGYGMRASILHDWLYTFWPFTRRECDDIYHRALTTGDGTDLLPRRPIGRSLELPKDTDKFWVFFACRLILLLR